MSDTNIHALPVGHTFDGYRILRLLGAGGFGITYLAEETMIGRKVAIKEYLPQGFAARAADSFTVRPVSTSSKEQFAWGLDRFQKEAATLVAFEHPNIVSVYRYFEANGTAYLVMQYVEGKPLDALLAGGKTLAESEIEEVILPILDGLEQVHAAHFLHRDIKPANIYIRRDGRPVLLDFGAARQAFGSETKSITAIVSEGYAPFEQYEVKGDQGPWTDVYAIGAVLYRCITGERPPAAPERVSARLRGTPDPMPPAREAGAGRYSARLLEATDRALSTMQGDRPQSVGALRETLRAGERGATSFAPASRGAESAGTPTLMPAAGAAKPRSRLPIAAGIAGVLLAGGAGAYFALSPGKAPEPSIAAPATPPTKVSSTAPATPPQTTPAQPPAEPAADREAREAAERAEADLAQIKAAAEQGGLERARDDLKAVQRRLDEALQKRPRHAALERARGLAAAAESDLSRRIAARVKQLIGDAEREAQQNYDQAQRLLAEAERLDPAAAKSARDRIEQGRRSEAEKRRDDDAKRARVELHISLARYHFDQARSSVTQGRLAEARRTIEQVKVQIARAVEVAAEVKPAPGAKSPEVQVKELGGEVEAFERDLGKRIAERMAVLLREARAFLQAGKLDEAAKRLEEATDLDAGSADLAAARREFEEARSKPQTPADPDAAERERTRGVVRDAYYDARGRRGAVYFAFGDALIMAPPGATLLLRGVNAALATAHPSIEFICSFDLLEVKSPEEGRKLADQRCASAQRVAVDFAGSGRLVVVPRIIRQPGKGPDYRRIAFAVVGEKPADKPPETAKPPDTSRPGAFALAGRTARLSRISSERRAVMRIELHFNAGGALAVSCSAESADGGQSACFGQRSGAGRWSLSGSTLCVSSPVLNLSGNACYEVSGSGNQLRLAGGGLLAGVMLLQ